MIESAEPRFTRLFSEKTLLALCVVMVIGMIVAAAYAFANPGSDASARTVGSAPLQSSPSGVQALGAPVAYSPLALPLVECSTTFPSPSESELVMPAMIEEEVPTALGSELSVYTDGRGIIKVLGPSGWSCSAQLAQDGASVLDVYPASELHVRLDEFATPLGDLPSGSPDREIYARQTSACTSCTATQACPLFRAAAAALAREFSWSCPTSPPKGEVLTSISPSAYEIVDPPGVIGDAFPSGGANSSHAVMTYRLHDANGSWMDSCLLPASQADLCQASLNNFFSHYGSR